MAETIELARIFLHEIDGKKVALSDPNPLWSAEAVMDHYTGIYPELVSAKCEGPVIKDDKEQFTFTSVMGVKG
ncbi:PRTRC system protein C [Olivibacter jilunii]|uniref:PRTRC system protein C n=1 Tax=Olivibacter jilunii TaxID=985016 RepID=UPI001030B9B7|nr:PRTRC system protein C [Olivibacter jilunii]